MTRYYFHIRDGRNLIRDEEGIECSDLGAVRREAFLSARDIVREAFHGDLMGPAAKIEVEDEHGGAIDFGSAAGIGVH